MGIEPLLYLHFQQKRFAYSIWVGQGKGFCNEVHNAPVHKERLKDALGVMELPIQERPGFYLVFGGCWPIT